MQQIVKEVLNTGIGVPVLQGDGEKGALQDRLDEQYLGRTSCRVGKVITFNWSCSEVNTEARNCDVEGGGGQHLLHLMPPVCPLA